jgi:F0F1-type ATP synthase membrane subunit a
MLLITTGNITDKIEIPIIDVIGIFVLIPIHIYFDLMSGFIQAFVFMLLTMVY